MANTKVSIVHTLSLKIVIDNPKTRRAVLTNLEIEAVHDRTNRARVNVFEEGSNLQIDIEANDLIMLRAFSNSIFRILKTTLEITELLNQ